MCSWDDVQRQKGIMIDLEAASKRERFIAVYDLFTRTHIQCIGQATDDAPAPLCCIVVCVKPITGYGKHCAFSSLQCHAV